MQEVFKLGIRGIFITARIVKPWNRLPWEVFKSWQTSVRNCLVPRCPTVWLHRSDEWCRVSLQVSSPTGLASEVGLWAQPSTARNQLGTSPTPRTWVQPHRSWNLAAGSGNCWCYHFSAIKFPDLYGVLQASWHNSMGQIWSMGQGLCIPGLLGLECYWIHDSPGNMWKARGLESITFIGPTV